MAKEKVLTQEAPSNGIGGGKERGVESKVVRMKIWKAEDQWEKV